MGTRARALANAAETDLALRELARESGPLFAGATLVQFGLTVVTWTLGEFHVLDLALLALWSASALLALRGVIPASVLPWLWAGLATVTAGALCVQMAQHERLVPFGYLLIISAVMPPLALLWRPVIVAGTLIVLVVVLLGVRTGDSAMWSDITPTDAVLQTIGALLGGSVALYFRRRSLAAMVDETEVLETKAQTDGLTGVLNRRGIDDRGRRLVDRARGPVFALFVDINGLKGINDVQGHDVGDEVIRAVALALRNVMRAGDLVGRWGGDEFVVVGPGSAPEPHVVEMRILQVLATLGVTRFSTAGVSVGGASGVLGYDALIEAADEDMYERRAARRRATPPA